MATTTFQALRRQLAVYLGYGDKVGLSFSDAWTTSATITGAAIIVSSELRDQGFDDLGAAGSGDDIFQGHWAYALGTGNNAIERLVKSYDASGGQLTVAGTNLALETGNIDFEIHKYKPSLLRDCLNRARVKAYPFLHLPVTKTLFTSRGQVRYEVPSVIIGKPLRIWLEQGVQSDFANNILTDGGFEIWTDATTLTNYTGTTLDVAREAETTSPKNYAVFRDGYSARCTSQTGSVGTLLQTISSPGTYSGQRLALSVWVYCLTASIVSVRLTVNGTISLGTAGSGGLHTGTGWELLTLTVDSLVTITSLTAGISVVATATDNTEFYVDEAILTVGPLQEPETYGQELLNWELTPQVQGTTLRNEVVFAAAFPDNYRLRFEGMGYLTSLSAETDTIEIGQPQTELLLSFAAQELYQMLLQQSAIADKSYWASMLRQVEAEIERNMVYAMPYPRARLQNPMEE